VIAVVAGSLLLALFLALARACPRRQLPRRLLVILFAFFFRHVSSRITGLIGSSSNPVSGMTIATLILTCTSSCPGWTGDYYAPVRLCVGAVVCIAAANAGATATGLKTGYSSVPPRVPADGAPYRRRHSSLVIGLTTLYLHNVMSIGSSALPAPQATLMATIIRGLLSQNLPWGLCWWRVHFR